MDLLVARNPEALRYRGDHLFEAGSLEEAAEIYTPLDSLEQARALEDFDVQMERALFFYRCGDCLRQIGRAEEALTRYQSALELNGSLRSQRPLLVGCPPTSMRRDLERDATALAP